MQRAFRPEGTEKGCRIPSSHQSIPAAWSAVPRRCNGQSVAASASSGTALQQDATATVEQLCNIIIKQPHSNSMHPQAAASCSVMCTSSQHSSNQQQQHLVRPPDDVVLQQLLLAVLGDLESVTADPQLRNVLFRLPPSSLRLLLSSDHVIITSEDTVWLTVQQYIEHHIAGKAAQQQRPAWDIDPAYTAALYEDMYSMVRMPHLTDYCLSAADSVLQQAAEAYGSEGGLLLLSQHVALMNEWRCLDGCIPADRIAQLVEDGAPDSWLLPARTALSPLVQPI